MKHVIIPTDFSLRSLDTVRAAITHFAGEPLAVTLLHLLEPPTDITAGLRLAYRADGRPAIPAAFTLAVESIAAVFQGQVQALKVKMCYGSTTPAVRNVLEYLGANAILLDPDMPFAKSSPSSVTDPCPLLRRAMPRHVVEVGAPVRPAASSAPVHAQPRPARIPATARLQPAGHSASDNLLLNTDFLRHAS